MYTSLMGTFDIPPHSIHINVISSSKAPTRRDFFQTHYFSDPWTLTSPAIILEEGQVGGIKFPISVAEIAYQYIIEFADSDPVCPSPEHLDGDVALYWTLNSSSTQDCLNIVLPSQEEILKEMTDVERPLDDLHHQSYVLPDL